MADQTRLVCVALTTLDRIARLDSNTVDLLKYSTPGARDGSAVMVRLFADAVTNVVQLVATAVVVVLVPGSSG